MKKIKLALAIPLFMVAVAVHAQDSTNVSGSQDKSAATAQDKSGPGVGAQDQDQSPDYRRDMTIIQSSEVPAALRSTLQGAQYKGWEDNSTIYRSQNNDSYIMEMRSGNGIKVHRFDQNGNPVKDY